MPLGWAVLKYHHALILRGRAAAGKVGLISLAKWRTSWGLGAFSGMCVRIKNSLSQNNNSTHLRGTGRLKELVL